MLQLGRGFSAAERSASANRDPMKYPASIGPRLFSRGKARWQKDVDIAMNASIGPRLFSRGKRTCGPRGTCPTSLQLGRGFSAAERQARPAPWKTCGRFNWAAAFQPRKDGRSRAPCFVSSWLQLGRGFSAAESCFWPMACVWGMGCFNWAAAFQPRKVGGVPERRRARHSASIGPRLFSRGKVHLV